MSVPEKQMRTRYGTTKTALIGGFVVVTAIAAGVAAFVFLDSRGPVTALGPEYTYDISEYAKIDPVLILYQQQGPEIHTGLTQSRVITIAPDGTLWIAGDRKIISLDSHGVLLRTLECPVEPTCLGFDGNGRLYVGLTDHIGVFDPDGTKIGEWDKPSDSALLTSLALTGEHLFVADAGNKIILHYQKDGTLLSSFGQKDIDNNIPGFLIPSPYSFNIAIAPDGLLRIVNPGRHLIEAWTLDGHREWWWGQTSMRVEGFSGCCNPAAFAILPNGNFITSEKGLIRIKEYDTDGHFVGVVAGPDQLGPIEPLRVYENSQHSQVRGFGVAVDVTGRVYVLDVIRNIVRIFEKKAS